MSTSIFYDLGASTNVRVSSTSYKEETGVTLDSSSYLKMFNILKDISAKKKNYTEAYLSSGTQNYETETFFNIWRTGDFNKKAVSSSLAYELYEQSYDDNIDTISEKYYGNDGLWWVIALANDINNPFEETQVLGKLKILNQGYIYQILRDLMDIAKL